MTESFPKYGASAPPCVAEALAAGQAPIGRCDTCRRSFFYPRHRCPHCFASTTRCISLAGPFSVRSAVTVQRQQNDVFDAPGGVLMVAAMLDDDVTLIAEGHGWESGRPAAGSPARYEVIRRDDGTPVPVLTPWDEGETTNLTPDTP